MVEDNLLELYSPIQVDIIDRDGSGQAFPLQTVGPEYKREYLDGIMQVLWGLQSQEDARNAFTASVQDWSEVCEKITSVTRATALIDDRPYGVYFCRSKEQLDSDDIKDLELYCQNQWEHGWGEGYAHCSGKGSGLGLYIHFWQDDCAPLLTREQLEAVHHAEHNMPAVTVTEITQDTFWTLIAQAKDVCGQDQKALIYCLTEQLLTMGSEQIFNFQNIMCSYMKLADKYGLWNAAMLIWKDSGSRDGFEDFRTWLIAQGKDVYLAALRDPDSLADIPDYGECRFEALLYVGDMAYERLTGHTAYADIEPDIRRQLLAELRRGIVYGAGIDYPHEWSEVAAYLPHLCAAHTTPEELRAYARQGHLWNHDDPDIQRARAAAPQKKARGNKKKGGDAR